MANKEMQTRPSNVIKLKKTWVNVGSAESTLINWDILHKSLASN